VQCTSQCPQGWRVAWLPAPQSCQACLLQRGPCCIPPPSPLPPPTSPTHLAPCLLYSFALSNSPSRPWVAVSPRPPGRTCGGRANPRQHGMPDVMQLRCLPTELQGCLCTHACCVADPSPGGSSLLLRTSRSAATTVRSGKAAFQAETSSSPPSPPPPPGGRCRP
jgi:hypothetical protein